MGHILNQGLKERSLVHFLWRLKMFGNKIPNYRLGGWGEKLLLFYMVGVLLGIVLLQFPDQEFLSRYGFFSESTIEQLRFMDVNGKGLFFYCLRNRGIIAVLLIVFALTNLAPVIAAVFVGWVGLGTGAWITVASIRYGIQGPLLYIAVIMPQALCYLPAFIFYIRWMMGYHMGKERVFSKMAQLFVIFALFLLGILLESYVNPILLKNFIKIFL